MSTTESDNDLEPNPVKILGDPLREVTRKERRNLLLASAAGFLVAWAGVVPEEVAALGITLSAPERAKFLWLIVGIILYFIAAFALYGWSDLLVWRKKFQDYRGSLSLAAQTWTLDDQQREDERRAIYDVPDDSWLFRQSQPAAIARGAFEFFIPIALGLIAIGLLLLSAVDL